MTTKQIDPAALASITTGTLLVEFSTFHEAAEWVAGHPVWTHEFADKAMNERLMLEVVRQFPTMPTEKPADWQALRDSIRAELGETVAVEQGAGRRTEDPISSAHRILKG